MPAGICLPQDLVEKFKGAIVSGKINPERLHQMTTTQRMKLFTEIAGEGNAKFLNREFESKLLLKRQEQGILNWAKKYSGADAAKRAEIEAKIKANFAQRQQRLYHPDAENNEVFLEQLVRETLNRKYRVEPTAEQAQKIIRLKDKVDTTAAKMSPSGTFTTEADRMAYGRARTDLGSYVGELKLHIDNPSLGAMAKHPGEAAKDILSHPIKYASKVGGTAKSIKAAFDDSALLRQGWKTLLTHPGIWGRNVRHNVEDLMNQGIKGKDVMREATADVISRPYANYYEKMGIAPKVEEEFGDPTLVMKIPGIGRIYKTTEVAFNAFMLRTRADLADYTIDVAKIINGEEPLKSGFFKRLDAKLSPVKIVNLDNTEEIKSIGKMIGGITGRGDLGRFEGAAANATNNIFFSPRFVKSQIDTVMHPITGAGGSNFVRVEAAKNLVKIVGATTAIFAAVNAIRPGSVELDPRSTKFGKIKVGDTTFDLTGGAGSLAVLAARLYTNQYKSGSKGTITTLGSNPSAPKGTDLISQFVSGKLSPAAQRVWVHAVTKQEFNGAKPNAASDAYNLFTPLPFSTFTEAKNDPHGANPIATEIADALGLSANTSNPAQQAKPLSATDQALKTKIGAKQFSDYQTSYNDKLTSFLDTDFYKALPNDQKQAAYLRAESKIKSGLYKQYDFKRPKAASNKGFNKSVDAVVGG